ncbi:MAG: hypothetical protein AAGC43_14445 [Bacteroidota bacterium]
MKKPYLLFIIMGLAIACKTDKKSNPVNKNKMVIDTAIRVKPSKKNTDSIHSEEDYAEDEMKFMPPIEDKSYLGIEVGTRIVDHIDVLKPGTLKTGEGIFDVYYIMHEIDTLGYVFGQDMIKSIHIWYSKSFTNNGIGIGTTFGQLKEIFVEPKVHGSEIEARVHVFNQNHMYQLDHLSMEYNLDAKYIPDSVVVKEIIIVK